MTDREKVIKGIEHHMKGDCAGCPYCKGWSACDASSDNGLFISALALLKEQETVKPVKQIEENEWTVCGRCRKHLISKWMFCPYCGKAVKWE